MSRHRFGYFAIVEGVAVEGYFVDGAYGRPAAAYRLRADEEGASASVWVARGPTAPGFRAVDVSDHLRAVVRGNEVVPLVIGYLASR